ncbi:hypothetical protein ASE75_09510 [Sphingomonas sp. Leaf17]|uniref:GGDEF domain-containing protein n=1 Tax=Sphingomonas sp. Leaf17 TaxID=1735683 RepID=UPI0006FBFD36|nr:GGDEF domain-containing protein [Sphingomonas sp. Leaf17]KQM64224.1 hypothetical protein ASE75_09510 [Sphingomonas sp. Leaf17]
MPQIIDLTTLVLFGVLMNFSLCVALALAWGGRRDDIHFLYWSASVGWNAINFVLMCQDTLVTAAIGRPAYFSVTGLAIILLWVGIRRFDDRPVRIWIPAAMFVAPGIMLTIGDAIDPTVGRVASDLAWLALVGVAAFAVLKGCDGSIARRLAGWAIAGSIPCYFSGYLLPNVVPGGLLAETFSLLPYAGDPVLTVLTFFGLMVTANDRHRLELQRLSFTDPLTDAVNRRGLIARGDESLANPAGAVAVLLVDLDHFKAINDRHGHSAGDAVLVDFVRRSRAQLTDRRDFVARYGGEEFAVVLARSTPADALRTAESLRRQIEALPSRWKDDAIPFTISVGIAHARDGDTAILDVIERADAALYLAKNGGRNRIAA